MTGTDKSNGVRNTSGNTWLFPKKNIPVARKNEKPIRQRCRIIRLRSAGFDFSANKKSKINISKETAAIV